MEILVIQRSIHIAAVPDCRDQGPLLQIQCQDPAKSSIGREDFMVWIEQLQYSRWKRAAGRGGDMLF